MFEFMPILDVKEIRRKNLIALIDRLKSEGIIDNQDDFAQTSDINKSYLSQMIMSPDQKGARGVSDSKARQIEAAFKLKAYCLDKPCDIPVLEDGRMDKRILRPVINGEVSSDFAIVPMFDVHAACGLGYSNQNELIKGGLVFKDEWLRKKGVSPELGMSAITYADGYSMSSTIEPNDVLLYNLKINTYDQIKSGLIYAFIMNKELRVKRLFKTLNKGLRIVSDNPDKLTYPDEIIDPEDLDLVRIVGHIPWRGGDI